MILSDLCRRSGRLIVAALGVPVVFLLLVDGFDRGRIAGRERSVLGEARAAAPAGKPARDPVELNGPIFEGWPKPQAAIVLSGEQMGFLEPCGCAGLENQKGGLKRRHTLIKQLEARGWPVVGFDLGGLVRRYGPQAEIKFRFAVQSLARLNYRAIGLGLADLRLPVEQLVYVTTNLDEGTAPFVSANAGILGFDSGFQSRYQVVDVGGRRVGVTGILGKSFQAELRNQDIELLPPADALTDVVPRLREEADFLILLSHAEPAESKELARQFPQFDLVLTAGGADEPPKEMEKIDGTKAWLAEIGHKGMYVAVVGLYDDPGQAIRYQRVPLDARFADAPEMAQMMVDYQNELATVGLAGLGAVPSAHSSGRKFAGSATCVECHTEAAAVWEKTPHAHATQTLAKLNPPRHHDPECLSCHVTGWDPQKYQPFVSGYEGLDQTPHLAENGCENCHGPGAEHVAVESGELVVDGARRRELRSQMRLVLEEGEAEGRTASGKIGRVTAGCYECHDVDNSPDFDFKTYWPEVEHYGKD